jgi:hypothetical protein
MLAHGVQYNEGMDNVMTPCGRPEHLARIRVVENTTNRVLLRTHDLTEAATLWSRKVHSYTVKREVGAGTFADPVRHEAVPLQELQGAIAKAPWVC